MRHQDTHSINGLEFKIIYSRRRTIALSVMPDSAVVIRVPYFTPGRTIQRVVTEKEEWIRKHQKRFEGSYRSGHRQLFTEGSIYHFMGKPLRIKLSAMGKPFFRISEDQIDIGLKNIEDEKLIKKVLKSGYRIEAEKILPLLFWNVISKYPEISFQPSGLRIRSMRSRWGSCTIRGIITLNSELIRLPESHIEYVILHELCHLKHHNHGKDFYRFLESLSPSWKIYRKELKTFSLH